MDGNTAALIHLSDYSSSKPLLSGVPCCMIKSFSENNLRSNGSNVVIIESEYLLIDILLYIILLYIIFLSFKKIYIFKNSNKN